MTRKQSCGAYNLHRVSKGKGKREKEKGRSIKPFTCLPALAQVQVRLNLWHTTALLSIKQEQTFSPQILEIAVTASCRRLPKTLGNFRWKLFLVL